MCENLAYESVYFKEVHKDKEYNWPTSCRAVAAVFLTVFGVRSTRTQPLIFVGCCVHYWVSCAINTHIYLALRCKTNFQKIILLRVCRGIIEEKVTDKKTTNWRFGVGFCVKTYKSVANLLAWYLNFHQNLRSPHNLNSVGKSPKISWQGCPREVLQ